jgi:hypothetical protein
MKVIWEPFYAARFQEGVAWAIAALCLLLAARPAQAISLLKRKALWSGVLVAVALVVWGNFFQSRNNGRWIHRWDYFHTALGATYFPELGYSHLYDCAYMLGLMDGVPRMDMVKRVRDLRTYKLIRPRELDRSSDCVERFSPERRAAFVRDLRVFGDLGLSRHWQDLLNDKGYNGTPVYTLFARAAFSAVALSYESMLGYALVDILLLAIMAAVVARTRGVWAAALVVALISIFFPARFVHMGGSFLRFDYVAYTVIGLCILERRPALSGMMLALGTAQRLFPALFAAGILFHYVWEAVAQRRLARQHVAFAAAFVGSLAALFALTLAFGDGLQAWSEWWEKLRLHGEQTAAFRVGFRHMFMLDGNLTGPAGFVSFHDKAVAFAERKPLYLLAGAALLLPVLPLVRRWDAASFAALTGMLAFFVLLIATRYYYAIIVVLLLIRPELLGRRGYHLMVCALFVVSASTYCVARFDRFDAFLYNTWTSGLLTALSVAATSTCLWQLGLGTWRARSRRAASVQTTTPTAGHP